MIPQDIIDRVREATDLVEIVGRQVQLKASGKHYKGLCPFHREKTPSFIVNTDRQRYHCFGCGADGNAFDFIMHTQGRTFMEVLKELAGEARIPLPESPEAGDAEAEHRRRQLLAVTAWAASRYREGLAGPAGKPGRSYLEQRGVDPATAEHFGLGFAPERWDALVRAAARDHFSLESLEEAGLVLRKKSGKGHYDRFRGRLIFPIADTAGRVVAFGGRVLDQSEPKYLNSPETPVFRKGELLYGLHLAREAARAAKRVVLVEGYLDVIACHAAGVVETVGGLGTALTAPQARLLKRFAPTVVLLYDMDEAGRAAARRAFEVLLSEGLHVRTVELPGGKDPDEFLRRQGVAAFRRLVEASRPFMAMLLDAALARPDRGTAEGKQAIVDELAPLLNRLPHPIEQHEYRKQLAERLRLDEAVLAQALVRGDGRHARPSAPAPVMAGHDERPPVEEEELLSILLRFPHLLEQARDRLRTDWLQDRVLRVLAGRLLEAPTAEADEERVWLETWLTALEPDLSDRARSLALSSSWDEPGDPVRILDDCLRRLEGARLEERKHRLQQRIAEAQAEGDMEAFKHLAQEKRDVEERVKHLGLVWKPRQTNGFHPPHA